ncbi:MAG: uracil-DNA glycosylase [Phycisphaerales bacterium]
MPDRTAQLIAQHAETNRLLGVDFLPLGNASAVAAGLSGSPQPNLDPESSNPDEAPTIEPKPVARTKKIRSLDRDASEPSASPASVNPIEIRACHESLTDPQAKLDAVHKRYITDAPHQHFITDYNKIVFGEGDPQARLMFVGEAPGETEDQTGRPFVGRAGQLLDKMIVAMGLSRESVYICNVLKTRPPNNATPTAVEAGLCAPYLIEQIRIVQPEVIVTLGLPATRLLLETNEPMRAMRGRWWSFPPNRASSGSASSSSSPMSDPDLPEVPVMPTYHPAYLLRSYTEENRRKVWSDLCAVGERLGLPTRG